jgi:dCMP deaminase
MGIDSPQLTFAIFNFNSMNERIQPFFCMKSSPFLKGIEAALSQINDRPTWDEYFMGIAFLLAARSTCSRLKVGCVLVTNEEEGHRIIAGGYNGFLAGTPHTSRVRDDHEQGTVHAEQNAVTDAARRGVKLYNAIAYITHYPCIHCLKILISAGIQQIKYYHDYKNDPLVQLLAQESKLAIEPFS